MLEEDACRARAGAHPAPPSRPRNVDDIASQEDIIKSLKNATLSGNVRGAARGWDAARAEHAR